MKKIYLCLISFFMLTLITGCSTDTIKKIKIYQMESFAEIKKDSEVVITDSNDINIMSNAFNTAYKRPGNVSMVDPIYKVEIGKETYFLWLYETDTIGLITNVKETSTVYSFSEKTTTEVKEIINKHYNSND